MNCEIDLVLLMNFMVFFCSLVYVLVLVLLLIVMMVGLVLIDMFLVFGVLR